MLGIMPPGPGPGKPLSPGGILLIPRPGGPCKPGGGPIGGIWGPCRLCWLKMDCCELSGFVKMDLGIMEPCICDVGDMDLLVPGATCGVLGEEPCEPCCEVWRGRLGVGALGRAGVTRGDGIPVEEVCFKS
jgi:hypothetical protein